MTCIPRNAFFGCSSLKSVTIPNSVTSIEQGAFLDCKSLTSVTIPNGVTSLGKSVFQGCTSLTSVIIPNSLINIDEFAFYNCSSLKSVTIPTSVRSIGDCAFSKCSSLSSLTIPNSVKSIGKDIFDSPVNIPSSVTSVGGSSYDGEVTAGEFIDLGLPSGTLWASCNAGASSPEKIGNYYQWGVDKNETYGGKNPYMNYYSKKYKWDSCSYGDLPSTAQFKELKNECTWTQKDYKGRSGALVRGKNGNCIFLPFGGHYVGIDVEALGLRGYYWTNNHIDEKFASCIYIGPHGRNSIGSDIMQSARYESKPIRCVSKKKPISTTSSKKSTTPVRRKTTTTKR